MTKSREWPKLLLRWYDRHRRSLPWRAAKGTKPNAYHVWLSEIMLQQTTVATVKDYFLRFTTRWPTVNNLAKADLDEVLHVWQGLGYYARARNLHKAAQKMAHDHKGKVPDTHAQLLELPGVGPYTAGAIAAIAFNLPHAAVDANIERVMARLYAMAEPLAKIKPVIYEKLQALLPEDRPGDLLQAMMDLGSAICIAGEPRCSLCPLAAECVAFKKGIQAELPVKPAKKEKPKRVGAAYLVTNARGEILLRKREATRMLGGMMEIPSTDWDHKIEARRKFAHPPKIKWQELPGVVRHSFTHFDLELKILTARAPKTIWKNAEWADPTKLSDYALPTLFKKALRHGLKKIS